MKVALYCRVSTEEQARTGESILDQQQALERWARENGHEVADVYPDDGYSAHRSYKSRPQLQRLLSDVRAGKVELIAFTKFDRWTRRAADYYELQEILDRFRVPWTAILEDYETVTADGRFKVGIMLSVNQHEAERTSERIKFTFAEKRRRGEIISGHMPKGYMLVDKKPVKDPAAAPGVEAFWRTYLSGSGLKASLLAASAHGLHISASSGSFMLQNAKTYSGAIQGVSCDAYITPAEAERVLATRKTRTPPTGWPYLFSSLVICGECGGAFGAHRQRWQHADGTAGHMVFYNCSRHYRDAAACSCTVNIREAEIESRLLQVLGELITDEADRIERRIRDHKARARNDDTAKIRAKLERRKRRAWEAYLDELITKEQFKRETQQLDAELAALPAPEQIDEDAPRRLREAMPTGWRQMYDDLSIRQRREFWHRVLRKIEVLPNREIRIFLIGGTGDGFAAKIQQPDGYWIEVIKE